MFTAAITELKERLGADGYVDQPEAMQPYLTSMRNRHVAAAPLVARPSSTGQVTEIVKICRRHRLPIVPQGGNTGLVDGGIPSPRGDALVLSLSRMNKIRDIDSVGGIVTAEAGVVLQTLQEAVSLAGFLFPLSLASEGSAQIGGVIATNAGGSAVLRYGSTRQLTLGVEAVLADGSVLSNLRPLIKDNTGYNLSQMFVGAEGTLGIVTAATLRLFPQQRQKVTGIVAVPDAAAAMKLFAAFRSMGGEYLTAFEIMSQAALRLVVRHVPGARFPGRDDAPWYVLIELGSSSPDMPLATLFEDAVMPALEKGLALDAAAATSVAQAEAFWRLRESIPQALRAEGPQRLHFDISVPLAQIVDFMAATEKDIHAAAPDMVVMPFGHIGDGNIHYNMYAARPRAPEEFQALKKRVQAIVFGAVEQRHGSISAEHGIGVERKTVLAETKSPVALGLMRAVKRAFDPENLMNPGKVFD